MQSIKRIVATIYNYTHLVVGAGAVTVAFLDQQALSAKQAAAVVLISQGLKVFSNWVEVAHSSAPLAEKVLGVVEAEVKSVVHPPAGAPLEPAVPVAAQVPYQQAQSGVASTPPVA